MIYLAVKKEKSFFEEKKTCLYKMDQKFGLDIDTPTDLIKLSQVLCRSYQDKVTYRYILDGRNMEKHCPELLGIDAK